MGNQAENKKRLQELTVSAKEQEQAYQKALQENGFLEEQEYKSALLPAKEQAGRKKELEKYQLQVVECDTRLQSLKRQTEGKQEENLEKLLSQKEETRVQHGQKKSSLEKLSYRLQTNQRIVRRTKELLKDRRFFWRKCG